MGEGEKNQIKSKNEFMIANQIKSNRIMNWEKHYMPSNQHKQNQFQDTTLAVLWLDCVLQQSLQD